MWWWWWWSKVAEGRVAWARVFGDGGDDDDDKRWLRQGWRVAGRLRAEIREERGDREERENVCVYVGEQGRVIAVEGKPSGQLWT